MAHSFRSRLRSGETLFAPLMTLNSPAVTELMAEAGFDWLFIDAKHSTLDPSQMQSLLQAAGSTPCVIRLTSGDDVPIKKALDIGAAGIIVPQVNSADQARRIVQFAKYAPSGQRGLGIARAHRYGLKVREYMQSANDDTAVIVQAEHRDAVADIEAIVRVDGVDGVLIGGTISQRVWDYPARWITPTCAPRSNACGQPARPWACHWHLSASPPKPYGRTWTRVSR